MVQERLIARGIVKRYGAATVLRGPGAVGAIQAIKALGRSGQVSLFAFCAADTKLEGPYKGCAAQQPATYAEIVVKSIRDYVDGKTINPSVLLPVAIFKAGQTPPPGELG